MLVILMLLVFVFPLVASIAAPTAVAVLALLLPVTIP